MTTKFLIHLVLVSLHSVVTWTAWHKLCRAFQLWKSNMENTYETIIIIIRHQTLVIKALLVDNIS